MGRRNNTVPTALDSQIFGARNTQLKKSVIHKFLGSAGQTDLYLWEKPQVISLIRITTMAEVINKIHVIVGKQPMVLLMGNQITGVLMHGWVSTTICENCS